MPSGKKLKSSTRFRQTTLFDSSGQSTPRSRRKTRSQGHGGLAMVSPQKNSIPSNESSDDLSRIQFASIENPSSTTSKTIIISSDEDTSQQIPITSSRKKPASLRSSSTSENERTSDQRENKRRQSAHSDDNGPPRKKSRIYRRKSPKGENQSEDSGEESEDVAELVHEVEKERMLDSRLRHKSKSVYQQNLERLKRKKFQTKVDSDEDKQGDNTDSGEEDLDEIPAKPFKGSKPSGEESEDDADDDDDYTASDSSSDFIVHDEETDHVQLPPEFSMDTHEDASIQFKKIFQFFVHLAVQPAENRSAYMRKQIRNQQYFSVPLQVMRRKLSGLRDSLVSSSVWRPDFRKALEKFPQLELVRLDFAVPTCDACHLGGRMSTLLGRLSGSQYNEVGFQPKSREHSEDDIQKEFHLGRFCARRTRVFHEFSHWEHDLFQNIFREIDLLVNSHSSKRFHRIAYAGGTQPPQNLQDADGLCDWFDQRKVIDMEWQKIKSMMESAQYLGMDKKGDVDD